VSLLLAHLRRTKLASNGRSQASGNSVMQCCFWRNQACWLSPSVAHRAVEAKGPACIGVPVSLGFQGDSSMLCGREVSGAEFLCEPGSQTNR
jgi:hypothetical protein